MERMNQLAEMGALGERKGLENLYPAHPLNDLDLQQPALNKIDLDKINRLNFVDDEDSGDEGFDPENIPERKREELG